MNLRERGPVLLLGVLAIGLLALTIWQIAGFVAPRAALLGEVHCTYCGHTFEIPVDEKPSDVKCPECGRKAIQPIEAICFHCGKGITLAQLQAQGERAPEDAIRMLCPHCGKPYINIPSRSDPARKQ